MMVIDDFLSEYDKLKEYSATAVFEDVTSPYDGVTYSNVCKVIDPELQKEIYRKLCDIMKRDIDFHVCFMRRRPIGADVPCMAHHDLIMGKYSFMLYLNDNDNAGTAFIRHKETGISYAPESQAFMKIAINDMNKPAEWAILEQVSMKQNRALIFDAGLFHCAMPLEGFGEGFEARTVLTCFFS